MSRKPIPMLPEYDRSMTLSHLYFSCSLLFHAMVPLKGEPNKSAYLQSKKGILWCKKLYWFFCTVVSLTATIIDDRVVDIIKILGIIYSLSYFRFSFKHTYSHPYVEAREFFCQV